MEKKLNHHVLAIAAVSACCAASAAVFQVKPGDSLADVVAAARKGGGTNEIVVAPGSYYFTKPLTLDERDNGLTIRAEKPGTVFFYGGSRLSGWRPDGDGLWAVDLPEV